MLAFFAVPDCVRRIPSNGFAAFFLWLRIWKTAWHYLSSKSRLRIQTDSFFAPTFCQRRMIAARSAGVTRMRTYADLDLSLGFRGRAIVQTVYYPEFFVATTNMTCVSVPTTIMYRIKVILPQRL